MNTENVKRNSDKVKFSIGAKLILIVSFILIVSIGFTAVFAYSHIRNEMRVNGEDANYEVNRLAASDMDSLLFSIISNSKIFIQTAAALGSQRSFIQEASAIFFSGNSGIAAVYFVSTYGDAQVFTNRPYFLTHTLDESLAGTFFESRRFVLEQAGRGQNLIFNAAAFFSNPVLALFFPLQDGAAGVLFSSDKLNSELNNGISQSWMINSGGDILIHSDFSVIQDVINVSNLDFIKNIINSRETKEKQLVKADFGVFQPPSYSVNKDIILRIWERVKLFFQPVINMIAAKDTNANLKQQTQQFIAYTKLNSANAVLITGIEYDRVFDGINSIARFVICIATAALVISIIIAGLFSRSISVPLKSLSAAAKQIENGNFHNEINIKNSDETGLLAGNFGRMCCALENFGKFANKEIVLKSMRDDIACGPKNGTVFFSDIHDFAAKSENFSRFFGNDGSGKIVQWLNRYYAGMIECVEKTNGVTDKLIGDTLMAHWGTVYTTGHPRNDAFACIKAALMMRKVLYYMNKSRRKGDLSDPVIRTGCGISSGIVTAGRIGSDKHMEYTVIGEPVNMAAQISSFAKSLCADILISEETFNLVGEKFKTLEMPPVAVKGKENPVKVYAVINFLREPKGPQNIDEVRSLLGINLPELN